MSEAIPNDPMKKVPMAGKSALSGVGGPLLIGAGLLAVPAVVGYLLLKNNNAGPAPTDGKDKAGEAGVNGAATSGEMQNRRIALAVNQPGNPEAVARSVSVKVDPAMVKYRHVAGIDTRLASARAMMVDRAGNVLVAGDRVIRKMGTGGQAAGDIQLPESPNCMAMDAEGSIYIGFATRVDVYEADGKKKATFASLGEKTIVTGIAVAGENVYVADSGNRVVLRMDRSGKVINEIGRRDKSRGVDGLVVPSPHLEVAAAPDGSVWVNNTGMQRLENYTPEGRLDRYWGAPGVAIEKFPGCCNPTDFVLMKDGTFVTADKGYPRVKRYHADGRLESVVALPENFGQNMLGLDVAVDAQQRVLVLERGTGKVFVFEREGAGT